MFSSVLSKVVAPLLVLLPVTLPAAEVRKVINTGAKSEKDEREKVRIVAEGGEARRH